MNGVSGVGLHGVPVLNESRLSSLIDNIGKTIIYVGVGTPKTVLDDCTLPQKKN
jgi:hypothetical protein